MEKYVITSIKRGQNAWTFNGGALEIPYTMLPAQMKCIFRGCIISKEGVAPKISLPSQESLKSVSGCLVDIKGFIEKAFRETDIPPILLDNFLRSYVCPSFPDVSDLQQLATKDNLSSATKRIIIDTLADIIDEYRAQNTFADLVKVHAWAPKDIATLRNISKKIDNFEQFCKNPYKHFPGAALDILDKFALSFGLPRDSRAKGTIVHILNRRLNNDGDTCYPENQLIKEAVYQTTHADLKGNRVAFEAVLKDDYFTILETGSDNRYVYLTHVYEKEQATANKIIALKNAEIQPIDMKAVDALIDDYQENTKTRLSDEQRGAVRQIFESTNVLVVTGYPGTGKSTITKCIKYVHEKLYSIGKEEDTILFAAPTGIAATRLNNGKGMTIHRALHVMIDKKGQFIFTRNAKDPFTNRLIIIDEFSMVDLDIAYHLLDAIIAGVSKLVIIGDHNQLPSVGPGEVLKHIIESSTIPVVKLTRIFRQEGDAGGSDENPIFDLAKCINRGKMPTNLNNDRVKLISQGDSEEIYKIVAKLFAKHKQNCQILFPTKKDSTVGSIQGNRVIAAAAHDGEAPTKGGFSKGDKIVCTKNCVQNDENGEIDVKKSIFNGEIGRVNSVDLTTGKIGFVSESKNLFVRFDTIEHGWCITVNKAQGSEYDTVVVVLHPSQGPMLNRQVLYTAVTRAKKRVYIVSTLATLQRAINTQAPRRHSLLSSLLAMAAAE